LFVDKNERNEFFMCAKLAIISDFEINGELFCPKSDCFAQSAYAELLLNGNSQSIGFCEINNDNQVFRYRVLRKHETDASSSDVTGIAKYVSSGQTEKLVGYEVVFDSNGIAKSTLEGQVVDYLLDDKSTTKVLSILKLIDASSKEQGEIRAAKLAEKLLAAKRLSPVYGPQGVFGFLGLITTPSWLIGSLVSIVPSALYCATVIEDLRNGQTAKEYFSGKRV
jgi:hypothetical protein